MKRNVQQHTRLLLLTRHSLGHNVTSSTHPLGTLRGLRKLRVHKWLPPLLWHRTKEDSSAWIPVSESSVMMQQNYKRQKVKGNVSSVAEVAI